MANFSGHSNRLFSGLWSPIDSDVIFTGGDDSTVFGWRISAQKNNLPSKKVTKKVAQVKYTSIFCADFLAVFNTQNSAKGCDKIKTNFVSTDFCSFRLSLTENCIRNTVLV